MNNYSISDNRKEKKKLKEKRKECGMMSDCRTSGLRVPDWNVSAGV